MLTNLIPSQRIVRATAATLSFQGVDSDGEPTNPGTVTIGVVDAAGTEVVAPGTATTGIGDSPRTFDLSASQTAELGLFTATWTAGGVAVGTTVAEVVGGVYATTAELLELNQGLSDQTFTNDDRKAWLIARRPAAELQIEEWCKRAFVPRFCVERLHGTGGQALPLSWANLRTVEWVRVHSGTTYTEFTADEVASIGPNVSGVAIRGDGGCWPFGKNNIEVAYTHGLDRAPRDVKEALAAVILQRAYAPTAGIDSRATS